MYLQKYIYERDVFLTSLQHTSGPNIISCLWFFSMVTYNVGGKVTVIFMWSDERDHVWCWWRHFKVRDQNSTRQNQPSTQEQLSQSLFFMFFCFVVSNFPVNKTKYVILGVYLTRQLKLGAAVSVAWNMSIVSSKSGLWTTGPTTTNTLTLSLQLERSPWVPLFLLK